jgi:Smg protein
MFDVLVYLYENYGAFEACPDATALSRSLSDAGFDDEEIGDALSWLQGLARMVQETQAVPFEHCTGTRIYAASEMARLGSAAVGFLMVLDAAGQLGAKQREIVIERALAAGESPLSVATMKIIVLMVLWSHSADVDFLLLEELLDDDEPHLMH